MYWCSSWTLNLICIGGTIFLPMITLWQPNQPGLWKTTLKYKNLFSLTSKILGSYMWVFTVLQLKKVPTFLYTWSMKKGPQLQLGGAFTYRRRQAKTDFKTVHPDEINVFSIGKNFRFSSKKVYLWTCVKFAVRLLIRS